MKKLLLVFMTLLLLLSLSIPVCAQSLPLVVDMAGLLTQQEDAELTQTLERIRQEYGVDLVILTVNDLGGLSAQDYADGYYDDNGYSDDGALLLVDMGERQWYISTCGSCINTIDQDQIAVVFLPDLSAGNYFDSFMAFAAACEKAVYIPVQPDGPIITDSSGVTQGETFRWNTVWICLGIGAGVGLITVLILKGQLKTVRRQKSAENYICQPLHLGVSTDRFLYHTTTRREIPQNNTSHGSGGSRSHGGGGGSF